MLCQLISPIDNRSLLDVVLDNRNLTKEQVERLLKCGSEEYRNPFEIFNMDKAVNLFKKIYKKDMIIGILVDEDCDGYTSSTLLYQWLIDDLNHSKEKIRVFFHTKAKAHGLNTGIFSKMLKSDVELFLIADSSSNDKKQLKQLSEKGKYVIITDHHLVENYEEIENIVIVNNQLGDLSNNNLAGVGVTSKFIEALGYNVNKYKDIIAIGQIADVMDMLDYQNKAYVNEGLNNIQNPLVKEYFKKNRVNKPIINDVSYNLANYINAIVRAGTIEEKELMFRAFIGEEEEFDYTRRGGEVVKETLQERVVRLSSNAKSRQANSTKKAVELANKYIIRNHLENDKVIIIKNDNEFIDRNVVGLVCMKIADTHHKPCMILNKLNDEVYSGSMRSFGLDSFKNILEETNLMDWVKGHDNAAGVNIKIENVDKLRLALNERLKDVKYPEGRTYQVDGVLDIKDLNKKEMKEIAQLNSLWCGTAKKPQFVIKGIQIDSCKIEMTGKLKCEFKTNGIKFVKNWCSKAFFEDLTLANIKHFGRSIPLNITLVVEFGLDYYGNLIVEIVDANSSKNTQNKIIF